MNKAIDVLAGLPSVAVGVGAAVLVVGGVLLYYALKAAKDAENQKLDTGNPPIADDIGNEGEQPAGGDNEGDGNDGDEGDGDDSDKGEGEEEEGEEGSGSGSGSGTS